MMQVGVEKLDMKREAREVAKLTGASVERQKGWRRLGVTEGHVGQARVRVGLDQVSHMAILAGIADLGIPLEVANFAAEIAGEEVAFKVEQMDGMVQFVKEDGSAWDLSKEDQASILKAFHPHAGFGEILVVPVRRTEEGPEYMRPFFVNDVSEISASSAGANITITFGVSEFARDIAMRADAPFVTYRRSTPDFKFNDDGSVVVDVPFLSVELSNG